MTNRLSLGTRARALLPALIASTALLATAIAPANATASPDSAGFCEYAVLQPGETCQTSGLYTVTEVVAEVTGTKSGNICVAVHDEGILYGEKCANNYVAGGETHYGHAWVKNNSSTQLTVFGLFTYE